MIEGIELPTKKCLESLGRLGVRFGAAYNEGLLDFYATVGETTETLDAVAVPTVDEARTMCAKTGFTLDWIDHHPVGGSEIGTDDDLRDLLATLEDDDEEVDAEQRKILAESTLEFHRQLAAAVLPQKPSDAPRNLPRKEFAKLVRAFLREIGVKGVSVVTPNYSMAMGIEIRIPKREDFLTRPDGSVDWLNPENCPARLTNDAAEKLLAGFLCDHFPNHTNRSDSQVDRFDFRWSIN
jgi:hypothetical protein